MLHSKHPIGIVFLLSLCLSCSLLKKKQAGPAAPTVDARDTAALRELYYLSEASYLKGELAESKILFLRFVENSAEPGAGYFRLAEIAIRQNQLSEALAWNQKAQQSESHNYYYKVQQAELMQGMRDFEKAGNIWYTLALGHPKYWSLYQEAAINFKKSNLSDNLIQLCHVWENAFGLREEIADHYITGYEKKGQKDSVVYTWKRLVEKYPERRKYKEQLWKYYLASGDEENAKALFDELLREDPENSGIATTLCDHYGSSEKYGTRHWQAIYMVAGNHRLAFSAKAQCVLSPFGSRTGVSADSLKQLLEIITQLHGNESRVLQIAGDFYLQTKDFTKAVHQYSRLLTLNQNLYSVWVSLLDGLDSLGLYPRMHAVSDSMLMVFPSMVLPHAYAGKALLQLKQFDQSIEICEQGMLYATQNGQKNTLYLIMAGNLKLLMRYDESLRYCQRVLETDAANPEAYEGIGDAAYLLNKPDEAMKNWQKAKDLGLHSVRLNNKIKNKKIE